MIKTYRARYRLQMAPGVYREPGQLAPEVHTWLRAQSYVHMGRVVEVEVGEDEFATAVHEYCPQLAERLVGLLHIDPVILLERAPATKTAPAKAVSRRRPPPRRGKPVRRKPAKKVAAKKAPAAAKKA